MMYIYRNLARKDPKIWKWATSTIAWLRDIFNSSSPPDIELLNQLGKQFLTYPMDNEPMSEYASRVADKMEEVIINDNGVTRAVRRLNEKVYKMSKNTSSK